MSTENKDMDYDVIESSEIYFSNEVNSETHEDCNNDAVTVCVNNGVADLNCTPLYTDKSGVGHIRHNALPDDRDNLAYESYEIANTMVSSTDCNETYSLAEQDYDYYNSRQQTADHKYVENNKQNYPTVSADLEDEKNKEKFNAESLSYELQVGYKILTYLMSASNRCVSKLFLYPVDDNFPETSNYYAKIKEPMWMFKMKEKFESHQYGDITEFMADFRLMIENCYRFNGPDNFVSKKAQKLETMMKQKIALLSRDLREKLIGTSSANPDDDILTSAGLRRRIRNPNLADDPSQQLLSQLRRDREMQEKVDRRQKVEDRKAMEQARVQELQEWEDKVLGPEIKEKIRSMWELPQIGLFIYLNMESLGLEEEITQYQLERGLVFPRECSDFRRLMTCLLSTPHQRKSLKNFMPYYVWNNKLTIKVDYFYKVLSEKKGNISQACYKLGLDTRAFKMMGKKNPLLKNQFHELSYVKRVWILKNFCDHSLETQQYLQKTIEDIEAARPMDVREVVLGTDGKGYNYINFPMFTGKDIRMYKYLKFPEPSLESLHMTEWSLDSEKPSASSSRCSTPVNQKTGRGSENPSSSLRARALLQAAESKEASPLRDSSKPLGDAGDTKETAENDSGKIGSSKKRKRSSLFTGKRKRFKQSMKKVLGASKLSNNCDANDDQCDDETCDNLDNASTSTNSLNKTAEVNVGVKEDIKVNHKTETSDATLTSPDNKDSAKNIVDKNVTKDSSLETKIKNEHLETVVDKKETIKDEADKEDKSKIKTEQSPDVPEVENVDRKIKKEDDQNSEKDIKIEEIKKEDDDTDEEDILDVGKIELVAESMEDIRQLMNKLSSPDPIKRGKRTYPGVIKPCEEELLANVTRFHDELVKYEKSLTNARVNQQSKLRKEVETYAEPKLEETKAWDSDNSQSSKDSSDNEESTADAVRQSKRIKNKQTSSTGALLSSAASKLSTITAEGNEDSNDSFELDISSRGRLRKRRIIPNNTEDTGIKKRKNIPIQESTFMATTTASTVGLATVVTSSQDMVQPSNMLMLRSPQPNSAIRAQLATPAGQVVRLTADRAIKTLRLSGQPNMIISPQSLSNLRFITSTGIVTLPRNSLSTSSAQASHPVIQQLLLNQTRSTQVVTKTVSSAPRPARPLQVSNPTTVSASTIKLSNVISLPPSVTTSSSKLISPLSGGQIGSKVLDVGLSVSQIQQLIKNQSIQINTSSGNPATLVLTTGFETNKPSTVTTTSMNAVTNSPINIRIPNAPVQQSKVVAVPSLMTVLNKTPVSLAQVLVSGKSLNPLATVPGQNLSHQIRPLVRVSAPDIITQTGPIRHTSLVTSTPATPQQTLVRQVRAVVSSGSKVVPVPRIINSLNPMLNIRMSAVPGINIAQMSSVASTSHAPNASVPELSKTKIMTIPVMSPSKKYASNVTVKALLENRCSRKAGEDDSEMTDIDSCDSSLVLISSTNTVDQPGQAKVETDLMNQRPLVSMIPHTHPLSVDTGLTSRNSSSEIIVPTVNIKVPSPNTLPSVLHNKNGTTIVQSTKVPIPVASEAKSGDSLSPVHHACLSASVSRISGQLIGGVIMSQASPNNGTVTTTTSVHMSTPMTAMKNVMLKVTPQTGGPGQFVQGYMTPRGLVIPQSALVQQQQHNNNVILSQPVSGGFQVGQQPTQQLLVTSPTSSAANPSLKVMFINTCSQSSSTTPSIINSGHQPSNTPASELVKQLASNSHIQTNSQQQITIGPGINQQNILNMIQGGLSSSTMLPTQTIVNAPQIITLQGGNQIHHQPNVMIATTKTSTVQSKPSVVALQLQQLGQILNLNNVSQVQLPQQQLASLQHIGSTTRLVQPSQVLQLALNSQTGSQTVLPTPNGPQVVRLTTQVSSGVQAPGLSHLQPQGNIIIQQQQGQNIVVQQQVTNSSNLNQQFQNLTKPGPQAGHKPQTTLIGQSQNTASLVLSQLQSSGVPTSLSQIQYVMNPSSLAHTMANVSVVSSPLNKMAVTGNVNRIIRADSSSTLQVLPSQGNLLGNSSSLNTKSSLSQMMIPSTAAGQFLISPVKLPQQQTNLISPIKYIGAIQSPISATGQNPSQFVISPALGGLPSQVKPQVIYANQVGVEKKVPQLLVNQQVPSNSTHQASSTLPVPSKGGDTKTILYKIGDQYFSPATNLQPNPPILPANSTKPDVQLLVPPACIEASDQMLKNSKMPSQSSSANGVHQSGAQFSFSLSGPASFSHKPSLRSDGLVVLNGQTSVGVSEPVTGQYSVSGQRAQQTQRSANELSQQAENEAALNLLTLANQSINTPPHHTH